MLKVDEQEVPARNGFDYLKSSLSNVVNTEIRNKIDTLIQEVSSLRDVEKLLFCLLLPVDGAHASHSLCNTSLGFTSDDSDIVSSLDVNSLGVGMFSPGGPSALHLSNQVEQSQAYTWILSHLEEDPTTCLRKDEVYDDYRAYCDKHHMKTLNTADFGKVMKRAFPNVKPRRLGQRGQSRYCYGGMRKKTEVQPPFLPDLTTEAIGAGQASGRSTTSPVDHVSGSGDANQHLANNSPLIRLLKTNGTTDGDGCLVNWGEDNAIRSVLGVRGIVVADVAHIILEYAHQVFGVQFKSLFQLAQHLVTNRYVNSRSKHAFSLIAHAANPSNVSFSPPAMHVDALQKGTPKSAFDRIRNGRQNNSTNDGYVKLENQEIKSVTNSYTPSNITPNNRQASSSIDSFTLPSDHSESSVTSTSTTLNFSICNNNRNSRNRTVTPMLPTSDTPSNQLPTCTTPQPARNYGAYPHPRSSSHPVNSGGYSAAALASPAASFHANGQHFQSYFNFGQNQQSSPIQSPVAVNQVVHGYGGTPSLTHPAMALAAAAVAAHQKQQQISQNAICMNIPLSHGAIFSPNSPVDSRLSYTQLSVTTSSHRDINSGLESAHLSRHDTSYSSVSGYLSPLASGCQYTAAHQQHASSPYSRTQPPAPLPPGVGARSPYTPIGHSAVSVIDPGQTSLKRSVVPQPLDAPGAYEPSPRFHLGSRSPTKRARYISTASGSSNNSSTEGSVCNNTNATEHKDQYSVEQKSTADSTGQPTVTVGSMTSGQQLPTSVSSFNASGLARNFKPMDQPGTLPSPYYAGRYEGLEMHSPAPPSHHPTLSHHMPGNTSWNVPSLPPTATSNLSYEQQQQQRTGSDYMMNRTFGSLTSTSETNLKHNVFRPPITPFALELESDEDPDTLPRLGSSPGPQIPPSSPTEFLTFYSETASKSAQMRQKQYVPTGNTPHAHNTPDSEEHTGTSDTSSPCLSIASRDRNDARIGSQLKSGLETPPASNLVSTPHELMHRSLVSPASSVDSNDRTLIVMDNLNEANASMPKGLASAPSPTEGMKNNTILRQREELQNALSTPAPAENTPALSSLQSCPNSNSVQCSSSTDVSITAF